MFTGALDRGIRCKKNVWSMWNIDVIMPKARKVAECMKSMLLFSIVHKVVITGMKMNLNAAKIYIFIITMHQMTMCNGSRAL